MSFTDEDSLRPGSVFTDTDLKRLKEWLEDMKPKKSVQYYELRTDEIGALLARLEAAEAAILSAKFSEGIDFEVAYVLWKRAKGERGSKSKGE